MRAVRAPCKRARYFPGDPDETTRVAGERSDAEIAGVQPRTNRLLRVFCLAGAALDAVAGIAMLTPPLIRAMLGVSVEPSPALEYAMRSGAALMWGWTLLLVWASRKPAERWMVVALTIFPVVFGLVATEVAGLRAGFVDLPHMAPLFVVQGALAALGVAGLSFRPERVRGASRNSGLG
jgi:hypothetical protein